MSFYMSFEENGDDRARIEGGSISADNFDASDIKASLESIRSDHADSKGMDCSESKGGAKGDVIDAAKGTSLDKYAANIQERAEAKPSSPSFSGYKGLQPFTALTAEEKAAIEHSKSNSTSTMYVHSTISVPDVDRILLSVGLLLEQMVEEPSGEQDLFNPPPTMDSARPSTRRADQSRARDIFHFMKESFTLALWSPECNIISLVLITRLIGSTEVTLNYNNWDKILLCALLLAQKLWDDTPLANVDFPAIWQNVYPQEAIDLKVVNSMEKLFLILLSYDVHVSRSTYTQFYFELRDLSEQAFPLKPLSEEAGKRLELQGAQLHDELITAKDKWSAKMGNGAASMNTGGAAAPGGRMVFS